MRADLSTIAEAEIDSILLDEPTIRQRVEEMGRRIGSDYMGEDLLVVSVLNSSHLFCSDLIRAIDLPLTLDFIAPSRYKPGSGVEILQDLRESICGRHVLLVEDVVDTGLTLHFLMGLLGRRRPASLSVCALLSRPALRLAELPIRYCGFEIQADYAVGYGLDYQNRLRHLPYIGRIRL